MYFVCLYVWERRKSLCVSVSVVSVECVCVCTSEASLQQSGGSDPLLPRPLVLLEASPILPVHVCVIVVAKRTLALTKHTRTR